MLPVARPAVDRAKNGTIEWSKVHVEALDPPAKARSRWMPGHPPPTRGSCHRVMCTLFPFLQQGLRGRVGVFATVGCRRRATWGFKLPGLKRSQGGSVEWSKVTLDRAKSGPIEWTKVRLEALDPPAKARSRGMPGNPPPTRDSCVPLESMCVRTKRIFSLNLDK